MPARVARTRPRDKPGGGDNERSEAAPLRTEESGVALAKPRFLPQSRAPSRSRLPAHSRPGAALWLDFLGRCPIQEPTDGTTMKLTVAGSDRSQDLGSAIREAAGQREAVGGPRFLSPQHSALILKDAASERDYQERFIRLLSMRHGVDISTIRPLRRPGPAGWLVACLKNVLWKLLRYRIERIVEKQNVVNELLA